MDIKTEEKLIFLLLKDKITDAEKVIRENTVHFNKLLSIANAHSILPLICKQLLSVSDKSVIPDAVRDTLTTVLIKSAAIHTHMKHELQVFSDLCFSNNIGFLLIKGFAVDKSPLRQMNDIDVLVDKKDIDTIFTLLQSNGYTYVGSNVLSKKELNNPETQYKWNNQFQFKVPHSDLTIEVHTNLFEQDRIRLENLKGLLDNVELFCKNPIWDPELKSYIPQKEASLALLCVHSATKRSPSGNTFIIRHVYDIDRLLANGIDSDRFINLCNQFKINYFAHFSLCVTAHILHSKQAKELSAIIEKKLQGPERFLSRVHLRCYKGLGDASILYRNIYALMMPFVIGGGFKKSMRWYKELVLPPLWSQESRFGINRSSPLIYTTYITGPFLKVFSVFRRRLKRN